ncbi:hypothetical protein PPUJ20028_10820 [Pseudomonas putida]|nr:hypothetical protein PPUJ20028_10820 [Pseudomonas putida]
MHVAADLHRHADALLALVLDGEHGHPAFAQHLDFAFEGFFQVLRVQVLPAHDQHVFQAPGDEHFALAQEAQVAGAQPGLAVHFNEGTGAGFGVAPVTQGDARATGPDFTDLVVAQHLQVLRLDDTHRVAGLREAAAHQHAAFARLGAVGGESFSVQLQRGDALATAAAADEQGGFRQAVAGEEALRVEAAGLELVGERRQAVLADRLGAGIGHAPAAQVEPGQRGLADPFAAQAVGEIGAAADGATVLADGLQPALRPGQEVARRHQHARHAAENWLQQATDQAHVVIERQPADDHVVGVEVDAEALADQLFVGHQVAMADLHALGQRGGARGVLQEGDVIALQRGRAPVRRQRRVQAVHRQQFGGVVRRQRFQALQVFVQRRHGQQQAWFGIGDDRQQAFLVVLTCRLRRVGRHRDHARIQAAKERCHIIRATGEQQHRTVAEAGTGLQGGGDGARALVEVPIAEHRLLARGVGQKAQGYLVRGLCGALRQSLDQREREFEGVRHGVFLPVSG